MAELARGTVLDRPWGRTLGALALRGLTGQVNLIADAKTYSVGFHGGAVIGAYSPNMADSAARIALTNSLVSSTQVTEIVKRQLADKQRDEIELLAEYAHLVPEQAMRLRRRAIAQKAARSFALDKAHFVVEDHITVRWIPGSELDIRTVIYLGANQFLTESRLASELGQLGAWFQLIPELNDYLPQYGFGPAEQPVLEILAHGGGLPDVEDPAIDQRMARAVIYALVSCGQCNVEAQPRARWRHPQPVARQTSPHAGTPIVPQPSSGSGRNKAATQTPQAGSAAVARVTPSPQRAHPATAAPTQRSAVPARSQAPSNTPTNRPAPRGGRDTQNQPTFRRADTEQDAPRRQKSTTVVPQRRVQRRTEATNEVELLIKQRLALLATGADHYALLGLARESNNAHIQKAYFALARQLHPDRLAALGIDDKEREAQRLFAQVNTAFAVLSSDKRREEYLEVLDRGGEAAVRAEREAAEEMAERILGSEDAYRKGEAALRRDAIPLAIKELTRAVELNPDEAEYTATLAWAKFCSATDKMSVAAPTRRALHEAIQKSPHASVTAKFYLGRVERMLGKDRVALDLFEEVLQASPGHTEATAEVRVLQSRLGSGDKGGGGLFGRLKR